MKKWWEAREKGRKGEREWNEGQRGLGLTTGNGSGKTRKGRTGTSNLAGEKETTGKRDTPMAGMTTWRAFGKKGGRTAHSMGESDHLRPRARKVAVAAANSVVCVNAETKIVPLIKVEEAAGTGRFPVVARVVPFAGAGTLVTKVAVLTAVPFVVTAVWTTTRVVDDWG